MNPLTNVKNLNKLNERELQMGLAGSGSSWHRKYKDSAWIFVGGLPYDLTEGDVICVFSQYGELVNINMVRDKSTGKTKGFCFICYEDQRSTDLAVDNFNGIKLLGRTIRVDHVENYKVPKEDPKHELDEITKKIRSEGIAPRAASFSEGEEEELLAITPPKKKKKEKKVKKEKKNKRKKKKVKSSSEDSESDSGSSLDEEPPERRNVKQEPKVKTEKHDPDYYKYSHGDNRRSGSHRIKTEEGYRDRKIKERGNDKRHSHETDSEEERNYQKMKREREKFRQRHDSSSEEESSKRRRGDYRERQSEKDSDRRRERDRDRDRNRRYVPEGERRREREDGRNRERERDRERRRERSRSRDRDRRRRGDSRDRR